MLTLPESEPGKRQKRKMSVLAEWMPTLPEKEPLPGKCQAGARRALVITNS